MISIAQNWLLNKGYQFFLNKTAWLIPAIPPKSTTYHNKYSIIKEKDLVDVIEIKWPLKLRLKIYSWFDCYKNVISWCRLHQRGWSKLKLPLLGNNSFRIYANTLGASDLYQCTMTSWALLLYIGWLLTDIFSTFKQEILKIVTI